jgi:hypothetical protein
MKGILIITFQNLNSLLVPSFVSLGYPCYLLSSCIKTPMQRLTSYFSSSDLGFPVELRSLRYKFQFSPSARSVRKMAESIDHQSVHDLLVEIARRSGDMIAMAQPHVNTSGSKKNCIVFYIYWRIQISEMLTDKISGRFGHRD